MDQIVIVPNVLTKEQCNRLILDAAFEKTPNNIPAFSYKDYSGLERRDLSEHEISKSISAKFGFDAERSPILWYAAGTANPLHADNSINENGTIVKITNWKRSAIIFLNEEFDGGELIYPMQGICVKPRTGMMLVAPAGPDYSHFVTKTSADRYALVIRILN